MIHIVLFQPEKPANSGNILRLAMAIDAKVHIIGPLSFKLDDHAFLRAGMDYLMDADYEIYKNYEHFCNLNRQIKIFYITRFGQHLYSDINFTNSNEDIYLMFGKESTGIDKEILRNNLDKTLRIPILSSARSLNLSNCVAIVAYEVLRQQNFPSLAYQEQMRKNVID